VEDVTESVRVKMLLSRLVACFLLSGTWWSIRGGN